MGFTFKDKIKDMHIVKGSIPLQRNKKYNPLIPFEKLKVGNNYIEITLNENVKPGSLQTLVRYHSKRFIKYINPDAKFTIITENNKIKIYRIK